MEGSRSVDSLFLSLSSLRRLFPPELAKGSTVPLSSDLIFVINLLMAQHDNMQLDTLNLVVLVVLLLGSIAFFTKRTTYWAVARDAYGSSPPATNGYQNMPT